MILRHRKMTVMPSNNTGFQAGRLFGMFPDRLAHLMSVDKLQEPEPGTPWALDNGVFGAWSQGRAWSEEPFYRYLEAFQYHRPIWAAVPDWVADRERTLALWAHHAPIVRSFDVPLAFVVQDGMTPEDVPDEVDIIFVGGTTSWKWRTLKTWTSNFPRVHVGRVNTYSLLWIADLAGAESCDGTGWFRGDKRQLDGLVRYLQESSAGVRPQKEMELVS